MLEKTMHNVICIIVASGCLWSVIDAQGVNTTATMMMMMMMMMMLMMMMMVVVVVVVVVVRMMVVVVVVLMILLLLIKPARTPPSHSQDLSDLTSSSYWPANAFQRTPSELSEPVDPDEVDADGRGSPKRALGTC